MPGLLTPERRQRAKQRSRVKSKTKKSPTPQPSAKDDACGPRTVTPTTGSDRSFRWDDYGATGSPSPSLSLASSSSFSSPMRSNNSEKNQQTSFQTAATDSMYASDEDMPMDELMGMQKQRSLHIHRDYNIGSGNSIVSSSTRSSRAVSPQRRSSSGNTRSNSKSNATPTNEVGDVLGLSNIMRMVSPSNWNNVSGHDTESSTTGIQRMIAALDSGSTALRPPDLSRDECLLWDSLQTAMANDRNEQLSKFKAVERDLERKVIKAKTHSIDLERKVAAMAMATETPEGGEDGKPAARNAPERERDSDTKQLRQIESLRQELEAKERLLREQQESHDAEVLAIQRVLADVTTEKLRLEGGEDALAAEKESPTAPDPEAAHRGANADTDAYAGAEDSGRIASLTSELEDARAKLKEAAQENEKLATEVDALRTELETAKASADERDSAAEDRHRAQLGELEAAISSQKLENEKLHVEKMEIQVARATAQAEAEGFEAENEALEREAERAKQEREQAMLEVEELKQQRALAEQEIGNLKKEKEKALGEVEKLRKSTLNGAGKPAADAKVDAADNSSADTPGATDDGDESNANASAAEESGNKTVRAEEFEKLQQTLTATTLSLETSKKIIASLENANGSLAIESRTKLKEKEEELSVAQKESEERKRHLDSLATELRDLQRKQGDIEAADRRAMGQVANQKKLKALLESSLSDLQESVAVHECVSDASNIDEISEILGDTLNAIAVTIESAEQTIDGSFAAAASDADYAETTSEASSQVDVIHRKEPSRSMKHELDQKKIAVKRLEEALKKQNEEIRKLRYQLDVRGRGSNHSNNHSSNINNNSSTNNNENEQLRAEIQNLRQQCTTNMEVLAKKERELSVLRSSLKVDDNESGYISDDASDDEDDDDGTEVGSIMSAPKLNAYGPADAEAYATILSQANGRIGMPATAQVDEIESLKKDLMEALGEKESASKELKARRESLANAKMIISSLEKANKGMMEDLRSRLQDSNTAISSLLDKSKAHENEAEDLKQKLQKLEREKAEEREKYESELTELRRKARSDDGEESSLEEEKRTLAADLD